MALDEREILTLMRRTFDDLTENTGGKGPEGSQSLYQMRVNDRLCTLRPLLQ